MTNSDTGITMEMCNVHAAGNGEENEDRDGSEDGDRAGGGDEVKVTGGIAGHRQIWNGDGDGI